MTSSKFTAFKGTASAIALAAGLVGFAGQASAAATIVIVNNNAAGVGFNDTTVVAPVGGNTGTTLGQQRLIAFTHAANIWGATVTSAVPITIRAQFTALTCTATSATLGSAGSLQVFTNFANAPIAGAWYPGALANKLSGVDQSAANPDINANFNVNLGNANCLAGSPFYYGLDNNHGTNVDLITVLLHEMGHGLGFQTFTNGQTGVQQSSRPSAWDYFLLDNTTNKTWAEMTVAERMASGINSRHLVWTGANVTNFATGLLVRGTPAVIVSGPAAATVAGNYLAGGASFGPKVGTVVAKADIMPVVDQANGTGLACTPLSAVNARAVAGKIAMVDRGTCNFSAKAATVQAAGAIGMIVVDNVVTSTPDDLGGDDATITIPAVRITLPDGNKLKAALTKRTRTSSGVVGEIGLDMSQYAGADSLGRVLMYTPNPYVSGSSVSHWDTSATPNLVMEPAINGDLIHQVTLPTDLTFQLLKDIGW